MNLNTISLQEIHGKTAHVRNRITPHAMDFGQYPLPFKPYDQGRGLSLETVGEDPGAALDQDRLLPFLSAFVYLAYGVTHVRQAGAIPLLFRTVPSAGGLYPCHLYVGVIPRNHAQADHTIQLNHTRDGGERLGDTIETSLFYYDPPEHRLVLLRGSEEGGADVSKIVFSTVSKSDVSLVFIVTAALYNAAWKYRDRALRYVMLDAGHLAENLALAGRAQDLCLDYDFDDQKVAGLLNLDLDRELPLALATMGWDRSVSEAIHHLAAAHPCFPDLRTRPAEIAYMEKFPLPASVYDLGRQVCPGEEGLCRGWVWENQPTGYVADHRADLANRSGRSVGQRMVHSTEQLAGFMVRRRSRRNFIAQPVCAEDQQTLLAWIRESEKKRCWHPWITLAVACQNWEGMDDGLYIVDAKTAGLRLMTPGAFHSRLARACLGQEWIGQAGAVFLCLADFGFLEAEGGVRAYRYAMLAAGRLGQRLYLGAEETGQGCCGIGAIYDEEAAALLGLNRQAALLYALAVGPVKKKTR